MKQKVSVGSDDNVLKVVKNITDVFSEFVNLAGESYTAEELKKKASTPLTYEQKVKQFKNYELWVLSYAQLLVKGVRTVDSIERARVVGTEADGLGLERTEIESGFALMSILNAYVEVIGRLCGEFPFYPYNDSSKGKYLTPKQFIKAGIPLVIPEISTLKMKWQPEVANLLYEAVRNPLAHTSFTGRNVWLSQDHPQLLIFIPGGQVPPSIVINYIKWYEQLDRHFRNYISKLESTASGDPEIESLQKRFDARFPLVPTEE